jgi:two-component system OmpR family sensor kinase
MSLQRRLGLAITAAVLVSVFVSTLAGAFLVRRSIEHAGLNGLRRQLALLANVDLRPSPSPFGRFLATQDERLSVLPRAQARLLLPGGSDGRITVNGRDYLYATRAVGPNTIILLRTASSVSSASRPFWFALASAGALGCLLAAAVATRLARGIASPVVQVARASSRVAAGDSPHVLPVTGARELRDLTESFNTMADQLTRARNAERSFLLSVSHELKTPLTAIRGYAEGLEEGVLTRNHAVKVIRVEAARLERLVADLLQLARINRQRFDIQLETVDLSEIARDCTARHAASARELGVQLELDQSAPALARADPERLMQALSNLVENALRCTPKGGRVTVAAAAGELTVTDTGPGIAPEDVSHAFERFFLYRRYDGDRPVGTGLGLAIVKELAQAMGGDVEVESSRPGTAFTLHLPLVHGNSPTAPRVRRLHAFTQR